MMNTATKLALIVALAACFLGCDEATVLRPSYRSPSPLSQNRPDRESSKAEPSYLTSQTVEKADDMPGEGAVTKAMYWAEKYAEVSNELQASNARIGELEREIRKLNTQLATSNATLSATQNELADANLMLEEMKRDLKEWRNNVLGIRKEMADAMAAQLRASQQILRYLGADAPKSKSVASSSGR